jgi:hypothetical protein
MKSDLWYQPVPESLDAAITWTLAYADVFDYPLTAKEVHCYLVGTRVPLPVVKDRLDGGRLPAHVSRSGNYFTLSDREHLIETRRRRTRKAAEIWPGAIRLGRAIACLPFVRMVAVTGALSMNNVTDRDDIDYLIVTAEGRLWISRAIIIQLVVKPAARRGTDVCPNYILTERAFATFDHDLFTAHEMVQMVNVAGRSAYRRMYQLNDWVADFLPNAYGRPRTAGDVSPGPNRSRVSTVAETVLRTPIGARLEDWEMKRKVRRLRRGSEDGDESCFTTDRCKGHFGGHSALVRRALSERVASVLER